MSERPPVKLRSRETIEKMISDHQGVYALIVIDANGIFNSVFEQAGRCCEPDIIGTMLAESLAQCVRVHIFDPIEELGDDQVAKFVTCMVGEILESEVDVPVVQAHCLSLFREALAKFRKERGIQPRRVA